MKMLLCLAFLGFGLGLASAAQVSSKLSIDEFAQRYKKATTEHEKLLLCIDAIDQGQIARGGPIGNIDKIFGTHFTAKPLPKGTNLEWGTVDFGAILPSPPADEPQPDVPHVGWYLAFQFDYSGGIENYYLSNLHK